MCRSRRSRSKPARAPQPDDNSGYVPGSWIYNGSNFAWRPGYWTAMRPGWVWIPAHYVWTPSGYLFVDGYWDMPLDRRGLLFAPVAFAGSPWLDPDWSYTPSYVVDPAAIYDAGFYRPRSGHYYFGNYFGPGYTTLGFRPWFSGLGRYDPSFGYYASTQRGTPNWFAGYQGRYQARQQGTLAGPPRTVRQQTAGSVVTMPLSQFARQSGSMRIVRSSAAQINSQRAQIQRTRQLVQARTQRDASFAKNSGGSGVRTAAFSAPATVNKGYTPSGASTARYTPPVVHAPQVVHTARYTPPVTHAPQVAHASQVTHAAPTYHAPTYHPQTFAHTTHAMPARVAPVHAAPARAAPVHAAPARAAPVHHAASAGHSGHAPSRGGGSHHR